MRKRRSLLRDPSTVTGNIDFGSPDANYNDPGLHLTHHPHQHHSNLPPLSDAYEKSSREFEDIFDIDMNTLPASFFAEALGSLMGESGAESSLLNEDIFLDSCSNRCVKRCYSAPPSPLSGLLADFDEQGAIMELINNTQSEQNQTAATLAPIPSSVAEEPTDPWASLSSNDVLEVLEATNQRLAAEQLQREAESATLDLKNKQQHFATPQTLPRPPSAPPPTTHVPPFALAPTGSLSTRSDDPFTVEEIGSSRGNCFFSNSVDWRQPRRPRSTLPTGGSLFIPITTVRQHDIVRSRLASLATRRLRDKMTRNSTSSDRSPISISSDHFSFGSDQHFEISRQSSASTPTLILATPAVQAQPASSLATLLNGNSGVPDSSRSVASLTTPNGSIGSLSSSTHDSYRCIYQPSCTLSYDRPVRLHAHLLHHVYGMSGPYRCDVPTCSLTSLPSSAPASSSSKLVRTFPTTKQLWAHIETSHPEIFENKVVHPVDFTVLRHKSPQTCPSCDVSFVYAFQLYLHLRQYHVKPTVRSSAIVDKYPRLDIKKPVQSASSPFGCRLCGFQSPNMSGLLLHIQRKQHHRQAARNKPLTFTIAPLTNVQASLRAQNGKILPRTIVFRRSPVKGPPQTVTAKLISSSPSAGPSVQPVNITANSDSSAVKAVLVAVNPNSTMASGGSHIVQQPSPPSSSSSSSSGETATSSALHQFHRVVLVNVSH